jgi:DnaK suppressor protein
MAAKPSAAPALKKTPAKVSAKTAPTPPESAPREASPARQPKGAPGRLMTEAEILKAPDKEYMNAAQLAFFRNRLQDMEQEILKNAGETTEHLRETIIVPDPADRATIEEEHALELRTRDRERKLLKKIQQSILRIDSGDYGYCEETRDPIGVPRLLARPTATLSLEAQERREMKQKMYGE